MINTIGTSALLLSVCLASMLPAHSQPPPEKVEVLGVVVHGLTNQPIAGANVTVRRQIINQGPTEVKELSTRTDAKGKFKLKDVDEGKYWISASKRGFSYVSLTADVTPNQREINMKLIPMAKVAGTILKPDGSPLRNTMLSIGIHNLADEKTKQYYELSWGNMASARTDKTGHYEISIDACRFIMFVMAHGIGFGASTEHEIKPGGKVDRIDIRLNEGQSLVVRVIDEKTGAPIIGACTTVGNCYPFFVSTPLSSQGMFTDSEGAVRFNAVPPGMYQVYTSAAGYQGSTYGSAVLYPGQRERVVTVPLTLSPDAVFFSGRVFLKEGAKAVCNSRLKFSLAAIEKDEPWTQVVNSETRTDDQGMFRALLPTRGKDWIVYAHVPGTGCALVGPLSVDQSAKEMKGVDLALGPEATLKVLVRDEDGRGIPGLKVHFGAYLTPKVYTSDLLQPVPQTDEEGRFQCTGLFTGKYFVNVETQEFGDPQSFHVEPLKQGEATAEIIVDLVKGVEVSGKILQLKNQLPFGGLPFSVCTVSRSSAPFDVLHVDSGQTQADGSFVLGHVIRERGHLLLLAGDAGFAFSDSLDLTTAEEAAGLELTLQPGCRISGIARREGKPVMNAPVYAHVRQPDGSASKALCYAATSDDGRFTLDGLPPGEYAVSSTPESPAPPVKFLKVAVGQTVETDVEVR